MVTIDPNFFLANRLRKLTASDKRDSIVRLELKDENTGLCVVAYLPIKLAAEIGQSLTEQTKETT